MLAEEGLVSRNGGVHKRKRVENSRRERSREEQEVGRKEHRNGSHSLLMYSMVGLPQAQRPRERTVSCLLLQRDLGRGDQQRKGYLGPNPHWVVEVMAREGPGGLALGSALSLGARPDALKWL